MKNVIVTGANGFIGSALVKELANHGYDVYALARKDHHDNIPKLANVHFVPFDLNDMEAVKALLTSVNFTAYYHLAWTGSAGPGRADTKLQLQNAQYTIDCMKMAHELGCERFIVAGSIMEHETMAAAYTQGNKPGMGYIYGGGKVIAHIMCMSMAAKLGIELIWPEITNAYGPGEKSPRLVNTTIRKCIKEIAPEFTAGTQNYDFVYIDDVARAFRMIGEKGKTFHEYLIGSSQAKPLKDFLLEMKSAIAPDLEFKFGNVPFTGINLSLDAFDCSQTENDTGFKAEVSFGEGCQRTMEWWKKQED